MKIFLRWKFSIARNSFYGQTKRSVRKIIFQNFPEQVEVRGRDFFRGEKKGKKNKKKGGKRGKKKRKMEGVFCVTS
jgi:hypothetical protein